MIGFMKTMVISDFKAKCIAVLKNAQHDGEPLMITWHGHPLAKVVPVCGKAVSKTTSRGHLNRARCCAA